MDRECIRICRAINRFAETRTVSSCCGHGRKPFYICISFQHLDALARFLYFTEIIRFCIFRWKCEAEILGVGVIFRFESESIGKEAYEEANCIAGFMEKVFKYRKDHPKSEAHHITSSSDRVGQSTTKGKGISESEKA